MFFIKKKKIFLESDDLLLTFTNLNPDTILIVNPEKISNQNTLNKKQSNSTKNFPFMSAEIKSIKEEELWQKFLNFFLRNTHQHTEIEIFDNLRNETSYMDEDEWTNDVVGKVKQNHYNIKKNT